MEDDGTELGWLGRLAAWVLRRRGYEAVPRRELDATREALQDVRNEATSCWGYVRSSGHLRTVSGRKPKAFRRLTQHLETIIERARSAA